MRHGPAHLADRHCHKCGERKPLTEFHRRNRYGRQDWQTTCKECKKHVNRERFYGLTVEDYNRLLEAQQGGCALCGRTTLKLHIDHDHDTGQVRGLLCVNCNTALGKLGDTPAGLLRALSYLRGEP